VCAPLGRVNKRSVPQKGTAGPTQSSLHATAPISSLAFVAAAAVAASISHDTVSERAPCLESGAVSRASRARSSGLRSTVALPRSSLVSRSESRRANRVNASGLAYPANCH